MIGFPFNYNPSDNNQKTKLETFEKWLYSSSTHYQTFATEANLRPRQYNANGTQNKDYTKLQSDWTTTIYAKKTDSNFNYTSYNFSGDKGYEYATQMRQWYWTQLTS